MSCDQARDLFSVKVDGRLTAEDEAALDRHLRGCQDCASEWREFERVVVLLRSVEEARAPAGFRARVMELARPAPWYGRGLRRLFYPLHVKLPLEAAAVILVSTLVFLLYRQTPELQRSVEVAKPAQTTGVAPGAPPPLPAREARRPGVEADQPPASVAQPPAGAKAERDRSEPGRPQELAARSVPRLAPPAPLVVVGALRPKDPEGVGARLDDLVKRLGGTLVRDAERIGPGSTLEIVVAREAYGALLAGLSQLGELTAETPPEAATGSVLVMLRID